MEPNFHDGEYLLTDKISYRVGKPQLGDVVVFKAPPTFQDEFIKRIIGVPGDTVMVQNSHVFLNGQELPEKYLTPGTQIYPGKFAAEGQVLTVPQDSYFVLGDNREHSLDSRNIGFVPRDKITGKAWFVYWPVAKAGLVKIPAY